MSGFQSERQMRRARRAALVCAGAIGAAVMALAPVAASGPAPARAERLTLSARLHASVHAALVALRIAPPARA